MDCNPFFNLGGDVSVSMPNIHGSVCTPYLEIISQKTGMGVQLIALEFLFCISGIFCIVFCCVLYHSHHTLGPKYHLLCQIHLAVFCKFWVFFSGMCQLLRQLQMVTSSMCACQIDMQKWLDMMHFN